MADVKISALSDAAALAGTELIPLVQSAATVKSTPTAVSAYLASTVQTLTNKTFDTAGAGNSLRIAGVAVTANTGTGAVVRETSPTFVTPALGTPSALVLTNATGTPASIGLANGTGLPVSTGISGLGSNVAAFLATPSSANLAAALTDETGSGANVFANTPTLVTPVLGVAAGTSLALGGATIGSDALGVTGSATFSAGVVGASFAVTSSTVPNNGIYLSAANVLAFSSASTGRFTLNANSFAGANSSGPTVFNSAASATVPTLIPNRASTTTGWGAQASGNISGIAGGAEILRITSTAVTQIAGQTVRKGFTVATLPTGIEGGCAYVTDALAPAFLATVVGGGAVKCPVFYDGTNWVCG